MYRRVALGLGVFSSASLVGMAIPIAFAEEKPKFSPVYDEDVPFTSAPYAGTTEQSKPQDTKLAEAESELAKKLDLHNIKAGERRLQISELLESYLGDARQYLDRVLTNAGEKSAVYGQKYRESERSVAETLASLKSDKEDLLPSSIYVLIAGLSGSIFARRSNILFRATVPWIFGVGTFAYFLPHTWANVRSLTWKYEQEQVPTIAKKHAEAQKSLNDLAKQSGELYGESEKKVKSSVNSLREQIRKWTGY